MIASGIPGALERAVAMATDPATVRMGGFATRGLSPGGMFRALRNG